MEVNLYYLKRPFKYIIGALAYTLQELGHIAEIYNEIPFHKTNDLWIGVWNGCQEFPRNYIAYNFEPLALTNWSYMLPYLKNAKAVWDYSSANLSILNRHGINASLFPSGYSYFYEESYKNNVQKDFEEDIDILVYATPTPRREQIIQHLRTSGLKITWLGRDQDDNPGTLPKRDEYIARAKIVLSIVHSEPQMLGTNDFARLSYLIANKKFVICESVGDAVEVRWKDYIQLTSADKIKDLCNYFLQRPDERKAISERAYEYAIRNFQMRDMLPTIPV